MEKKTLTILVVIILIVAIGIAAWIMTLDTEDPIDEPVDPEQEEMEEEEEEEDDGIGERDLPPIDTEALYAHLEEAAEPYRGESIEVFISEGLPPYGPTQELTEEFEEATGIEVNYTRVPYPETFNRYIQALDHEEADVIDQEAKWVAAYEPYMVDLEEEFMDSPLLYENYDLDDFFYEGGLELFTDPETGKLFGLPNHVFAPGFYYIPQYFKDAGLVDDDGEPKIPSSFEEYYEFAKKLTEETEDGVWGTILSGSRTGIPDEIMTYYWASNGGEYFTEQMEPAIDNENMVEILDLYGKIWQEGYAHPDSPDTEVGEVINAVSNKEVAFGYNWTTYAKAAIGPLGVEADPDDPMTPRVIPFPQLDPDAREWLRESSFGYGVSKDSDNKEAAFLYVQWATSPEIQHRIARDFYIPDPARRSIYEDPYVTELYSHHPLMTEAIENHVKRVPYIPEWQWVDDTTSVFKHQAMQGELSPEEAAEQAAEALREEMEAEGYLGEGQTYPDYMTGRSSE